MIVCNHCGAKNQDNAKVCMVCGKQIESREKYTGVDNTPVLVAKTWFVILMLICFFPVGLILMWTKKKFNLVVRIIISAFFAIIIISSFGSSDKNSVTNNAEVVNETTINETTVVETVPETTAPVISETINEKMNRLINGYVKKQNDMGTRSKIDSVTVNENLGTEKSGDYIALVNLTWDVANSADTTKDMLKMLSEDIAANIYNDAEEIQEVALYWEVPYLKGNAKLSFERKNGGMFYTDEIYLFK